MGEADWELYLVIAVSAGGVIWAVEYMGFKIIDVLSSQSLSRHDAVDRAVDRVIKRLNDLEYQLKQVRMELRKLRGLDVDDDAFR